MSVTELRLFDPPPAGAARHHDRLTSLNAALAQKGGTEGEILRIFSEIDLGGLTDDELCDRMPGWNPPTVKTARSRLLRQGWLEDSTVRRPSATGSEMTVWRRVR